LEEGSLAISQELKERKQQLEIEKLKEQLAKAQNKAKATKVLKESEKLLQEHRAGNARKLKVSINQILPSNFWHITS
jgi:hypothetical protein